MTKQNKQYAVDTSSLIMWARHFKPFDENRVLHEWLNQQFESKEFILLSPVSKECEGTAEGDAVKAFNFLSDERLIQNIDIEADDEQHKLLDNEWAVLSQKEWLLKKAKSEEDKIRKWDIQKTRYIKSADCQLIFYAMEHKHDGIGIITEETHASNDRKPFRKIPAICELQGIDCCNAVEFMLKRHVNFSIEITRKEN